MTTSEPFPLDSFKDAATHLRRPFTPQAVKFKVQATWPKDEPSGGLIVAYIDARLAVERLNLIVPHLWFDEYEPLGTKHLICRLTVDGIARQDVGEGTGKGLYSDALKRAAVKFGVGVSLYAIPQMRLTVSDGHLKQRQGREGKTLELTPAGEKRVRAMYETWLAQRGKQAFGDPLDHGDADDAQGDAEVTAPVVESPAAEAKPAKEVASAEQRSAILSKAEETGTSHTLLANVIRLAAGAAPTLFVTEKDAEDWLGRALPELPADLVDKIIRNIDEEARSVPA